MTINVVVDNMLEGAQNARGTAVIVDVYRATSNMATMFELGAKEIYLASELQMARNKRQELAEKTGAKVYLCGESGGHTPSDFDFGNSPVETYDEIGDEFKGKTAVMVSTNGVRGILNAKKAKEVLTASFLNYQAVADYIRQTNPEQVTIVGMGEFGKPSPEDEGCSLFLQDILMGKPVNPDEVTETIANSWTTKLMKEFYGEDKANPVIEFVLNTDANFYVVPKLEGEKLVDAFK